MATKTIRKERTFTTDNVQVTKQTYYDFQAITAPAVTKFHSVGLDNARTMADTNCPGSGKFPMGMDFNFFQLAISFHRTTTAVPAIEWMHRFQKWVSMSYVTFFLANFKDVGQYPLADFLPPMMGGFEDAAATVAPTIMAGTTSPVLKDLGDLYITIEAQAPYHFELDSSLSNITWAAGEMRVGMHMRGELMREY